MRLIRKIAILIVVILIVIQFVQPNKNVSAGPFPDDITKVYDLPEDVRNTFVNKCYDCHSNNTKYPWYFHVQPVGWWLAAHIHDAKDELNFSAFRLYPADKADHKLEELQEVMEEGSMPLKSYVMLHPQAELSGREKEAILKWVATVRKKN